MNLESRIKNMEQLQLGFSTLEMLIAMAILITALVAVVLVSFGNQSLLTDSQTDAEALNQAQGLLENEQALARQDFSLVNSTSTTVSLDGLSYAESVNVSVTPPDFFTKNVTATVSWHGDHNRSEKVNLSALVTDFNGSVGGNTCNSSVPANWTPAALVKYNFSPGGLFPLGTPPNGAQSGGYLVSGIDAYKGKLYITVNDDVITGNSKLLPTFFIFDTTNQVAQPVFKSSLDNNATDSAGLNAVVVAENPATGKLYAYTADGLKSNFSTCTNGAGNNFACGQLQIIDVSNPALPVASYSYKIPGLTGSAGQSIGKSIFYSNGYIYLGLTTGGGPELQIIDVHNFPASPPQVVGNYSVGNTVNAILVKGHYVYLATPNSRELTILDVTDPGNIKTLPGFDAPDSSGNGKSLYSVGNSLYLGRTVTGSNPELYVLDGTNPSVIPTTALGTAEVSSSVNALIVRNYLAFLLTTKQGTAAGQLKILRVDNLNAIPQYSAAVNLPDGGGASANTGSGTAMDCEGNYLYIGSTDSGNNGYLSIETGL